MVLVKVLETIHWSRLEPLFQLMARNPREATRGFPDLTVWGRIQSNSSKLRALATDSKTTKSAGSVNLTPPGYQVAC